MRKLFRNFTKPKVSDRVHRASYISNFKKNYVQALMDLSLFDGSVVVSSKLASWFNWKQVDFPFNPILCLAFCAVHHSALYVLFIVHEQM